MWQRTGGKDTNVVGVILLFVVIIKHSIIYKLLQSYWSPRSLGTATIANIGNKVYINVLCYSVYTQTSHNLNRIIQYSPQQMLESSSPGLISKS